MLKNAEKLQQTLINSGFSWNTHKDAFAKLQEEISELQEAIDHAESHDRLLEEYGDCLFSLINIGCRLNLDSNVALNIAIKKYEKRTSYLYKKASELGVDFSTVPLETLLIWWKEAKDNV
ncbi:MazG nucleotide pyrophosphohydrolase domain-containing protein [Acinetobacter baumannii]|uniref:MazG nucleotide pyrophosphohydrolase domain-containing protein n=1 Tax=Acinetobacter baumannii TaxID=470 RepID=UPI00069506DA|nr:MazG nucleotide pyrophosphohydrolase domain-containing protein [Acinetobacter baumannii]